MTGAEEAGSKDSAVGFVLRQLGAFGGALTLLNLLRESVESVEWLHRVIESWHWHQAELGPLLRSVRQQLVADDAGAAAPFATLS